MNERSEQPVEHRQDGRRERGARRRAEIVAATLRVIERDGVAGVSHRSVATEAGVPVTSSTYYFATLDDLLVAALTESADAMLAELDDLLHEPSLDELAAAMAEYLTARRGRAIAEYELYLLAARRPELRPAANGWLTRLRDALAPYVPDETRLRVLLSTVDGMLIQGLIAETPPTAAEIAGRLRFLLGWAPPGDGGDVPMSGRSARP